MANRVPTNPYVVGNPLTEHDGYGFYGRKDIYDFLLQKLSAKVRPALLLHGHRRIGKTSILRQMHRFMPEDWKIVFYDVQGQADDTLEEILYGIAYEIDEVIDLGGVDQEDITRNTFQNEFLPRVYEKLQGNKDRLILLFDEFDVLDPEKSGQVFNYIRSWISKEQQVGYVFVVGRRPEKLSNIFRNLSTIVYPIGRLSRSETEKLVREPAKGKLEYSDETIERIWELTSGHPLATQLICFELWPRWIENGSVPRDAVDEIIPEALKIGDNQLNQIYDGLNRAIYRLFLSAIADTANDHGIAKLNNVLNHLSRLQVNVGPNLNEMRSNLTNWDILLDNGDSFRYSVDLVRQWVAKNRSLERMLHEAPLVSERAYRFYQRAEDLRQSLPGENEEDRETSLKESITNYKRALNINPLLVAAQVGLAYALMESGDFEGALEAGQKAYEIDSAQREVLVEAYLRQGENLESQAKFENALTIYNQLLYLGESQRAITRRNRLYVKLAENYALDGHYERAIEMIEQADAPNRYKELQEDWERYWQHQKSTIDSQAQVGNWHDALETLSEYLKRNPGDLRALKYQKDLEHRARIAWQNQAETYVSDDQLHEALILFEKAGAKKRADEISRLIEQKKRLAQIETYEKRKQWEAALVSLKEYENDYSEDEFTLKLRERLQSDLNKQINILENDKKIDQALETMKLYIQEFENPETISQETIQHQTRLEAANQKIKLEKAKDAAKRGNYSELETLLREVNRYDLAKELVTSGKRMEWSRPLLIKFVVLIVFIFGLAGLFYLGSQRDFDYFSEGSTFWWNLLFILVISGTIYLAIWIFIGDFFIVMPIFFRREKSTDLSPDEISVLEYRIGNRSYRRMALSHMLSVAVLFAVWELLFLFFAYDRAGPIDVMIDNISVIINETGMIWFWLVSTIFIGFFLGAIFSANFDYESDKKIFSADLEFGIGILIILLLPAILLIFVLPLLTHRWWGNFQIAHTVFQIIGLLVFGFLGIVTIWDLKDRENESSEPTKKEISKTTSIPESSFRRLRRTKDTPPSKIDWEKLLSSEDTTMDDRTRDLLRKAFLEAQAEEPSEEQEN